MKQSLSFGGICPAIVSPYDRKGRFDDDAFARLASRLYVEGVHGLYVCGLTGDGYSMTVPDRKQAARCAVKASRGRGFVMVHVGAQDTRTACELAEHGVDHGADAVASIPPINRTHAEVRGYYGELSRAAAGKPVLIYHIPPYTHHTPTADQFAELLDVPGVVGLKFTDYNLLLMSEIHARKPQATVLYGRDEQLIAGLMFGAAGGVGTTYNLAPQWYMKLWEAFRAGRFAEAMAWQKQLNSIMHELLPFGVMAGTEAWLQRHGWIHRCLRSPAQPVPPAAARRLVKQIDRILDTRS